LFAALLVCAGCRHVESRQVSTDLSATELPSINASEGPSQDIPKPPASTKDSIDNADASTTFEIDSESPPHSSELYNHFHDDMADLCPEIKQDFIHYYSWENFSMLVAGFSVGAVFANTPIDQTLRNQYQDHVRSSGTDNFARVCKDFGAGGYMFPAMAAGWFAGDVFYDSPWGDKLGEWGERSLRSTLVGGPPMLLMQYLTGASRPDQSDDGSGWRPLTSSHGVSGHAFVGGLVFINAAKMTDDLWLKAGFYVCSTLPAWSRINDDAHYTSQAFLGWWMAYCAAAAVDTTNRNPSDWHVVPLPIDDGVGMSLTFQY
jgi:hypothetical protein